jgi:PhnB protein
LEGGVAKAKKPAKKAKKAAKKAPRREAPGKKLERRASTRWNVHLSFDGRCEEAFRFYADSLGARSVYLLAYGDTPMADQVPEDFRRKIVHGTLALNDLVITGADALPEQYRKPQGFAVLLQTSSKEEAEDVFAKLARGGAVSMPLQETFWTARFGMLVDAYGVPWLVQGR